MPPSSAQQHPREDTDTRDPDDRRVSWAGLAHGMSLEQWRRIATRLDALPDLDDDDDESVVQ